MYTRTCACKYALFTKIKVIFVIACTPDSQFTTCNLFSHIEHLIKKYNIYDYIATKVHVRHIPCSTFWWSRGRCSIACAVAVREGSVAYGIDLCNDHNRVHRLWLSNDKLDYDPITADAARRNWMVRNPLILLWIRCGVYWNWTHQTLPLIPQLNINIQFLVGLKF